MLGLVIQDAQQFRKFSRRAGCRRNRISDSRSEPAAPLHTPEHDGEPAQGRTRRAIGVQFCVGEFPGSRPPVQREAAGLSTCSDRGRALARRACRGPLEASSDPPHDATRPGPPIRLVEVLHVQCAIPEEVSHAKSSGSSPALRFVSAIARSSDTRPANVAPRLCRTLSRTIPAATRSSWIEQPDGSHGNPCST